MTLLVTDRIQVFIDTESQVLISSIETHYESIMTRTLAVRLVVSKNGNVIKEYVKGE